MNMTVSGWDLDYFGNNIEEDKTLTLVKELSEHLLFICEAINNFNGTIVPVKISFVMFNGEEFSTIESTDNFSSIKELRSFMISCFPQYTSMFPNDRIEYS